MKRGDWLVIILGVLLVVSVTSFSIQKGKAQDDTNVALVNCRGEQYVYSLSKDQRITIEGNIGTSVIVIEDGLIYFESSPCRDHICENMGKAGGESGIHFLACLPNDVVVTVNGGSSGNRAVDY